MQSNPIIHFLLQIVTLRGSFVWDYVWTYLFNQYVLQGVLITVILSVLAQFLGSLIGLALYFLRRAHARPLRWFANRYIWLFRGTPLLVQMLFLGSLFPYLGISNPLDGTHLFSHLGFTIQVPLSFFAAALIALCLNEGAYMSEIVRAGIDSIDIGQLEAARSLGMTFRLAMRRIVLPQALRVIVPPLGNEFNSMLKSSSLASAIAVTELLDINNSFGSSFFKPLEFLTIASFWYLVLTSIWGFIQRRIERRLNASNIEPGSIQSRPWWQRSLGLGGRAGSAETAPEVVVPVPFDHR